MPVSVPHLHDELHSNTNRVTLETRYGPVTGGKASNGSTVFLEIPYASPPKRFEDPQQLPDDFKYPYKEFISESSYAAQPLNDGQAADTPFEEKVGLGSPTEDALFLNIYIPPSFPFKANFPVKVFIHGGFLQFGSPHSVATQEHFIAAERNEVWVNIAYRLSAFGFIASARHRLSGNYGFKDQWLALQWVRANIAAFGGNSEDVQIVGLSAGAHSVHQLLHHVSTLPENEDAPFSSAMLQSNAMLANPKTPTELEPQFEALCKALGLDSNSSDILDTLKDTEKVPWSTITQVIDSEKLGQYGTFRGCLSDDWVITNPGPMERQRNGDFGKSLQKHGVRYIITGEVSEEWYLYSIAHSVTNSLDIVPNLQRYFAPEVVQKLVERYPILPSSATEEEAARQFGDLLSCVQVYLPVRILARDLVETGFPILRYQIQWTPEECRPEGTSYVTHGSDRELWSLSLPALTKEQADIARSWLDAVDYEVENLKLGHPAQHSANEILVLDVDCKIHWAQDPQWKELTDLGATIFSGA
ncbi:alpha/beta-hydrolase [Coprinopsis marcescibilis]|uniref:Carboxylic ester hydrolase n=1 Tax=Coprinopsis marcescibilis TaxID=230819 RepID=A0A5C3KNG5_COPMA|nr:alpha/beta-hydrolase [Coprinopsis marcescibilis]